MKRAPETLREWVLETRLNRTSGSLAQEQLYLLDIVGFDALEPETKVLQAKTRSGKVGSTSWLSTSASPGNCDPSYSEREKGGLGKWVAKTTIVVQEWKTFRRNASFDCVL